MWLQEAEQRGADGGEVTEVTGHFITAGAAG